MDFILVKMDHRFERAQESMLMQTRQQLTDEQIESLIERLAESF